VSCFFLDTGKNVVDYVRMIHHILAPGGYWLNLGPLLYHYEDVPGEASLELSYEELREVTLRLGFDILVRRAPFGAATHADRARRAGGAPRDERVRRQRALDVLSHLSRRPVHRSQARRARTRQHRRLARSIY
jgi:hypothetical protein